MLPDGTRIICTICHMFPGLDLYHADPAQPLTKAGAELHDFDHDLSDLSDQSVPSVNFTKSWHWKGLST